MGAYVINFVFSIGKLPYREAINFVSFIHAIYNYSGIRHNSLNAYKLLLSCSKYNKHSVE